MRDDARRLYRVVWLVRRLRRLKLTSGLSLPDLSLPGLSLPGLSFPGLSGPGEFHSRGAGQPGRARHRGQ